MKKWEPLHITFHNPSFELSNMNFAQKEAVRVIRVGTEFDFLSIQVTESQQCLWIPKYFVVCTEFPMDSNFISPNEKLIFPNSFSLINT